LGEIGIGWAAAVAQPGCRLSCLSGYPQWTLLSLDGCVLRILLRIHTDRRQLGYENIHHNLTNPDARGMKQLPMR
jgi:hypothetical protein